MKKLLFLIAIAVMTLCSCEQKDRIYTEDELGLTIDWESNGWSVVFNDLDETIRLETTYEGREAVSSVIEPGDSVKLWRGAFYAGISIEESCTASIIFGDEEAIFCVHGSHTAWSKRFYENFEQRHEFEIVDFNGKNLRHNLTIISYHIDEQLVELWRTWLEQLGKNDNEEDEGMGGDWQDIELDKAEVFFSSDGGEETVTSLNYKYWWILYGYEDAQNVNGKIEYTNFVYAVSSGKPHYNLRDTLDGGWYHAEVPCVEGEDYLGNTLVITVEPNTTGQPRQATIEMTVGDSFTTVKVCQQ